MQMFIDDDSTRHEEPTKVTEKVRNPGGWRDE